MLPSSKTSRQKGKFSLLSKHFELDAFEVFLGIELSLLIDSFYASFGILQIKNLDFLSFE